MEEAKKGRFCTHIVEAGNIRFGLEMRRLAMGDGGLAIHVEPTPNLGAAD